MPMTPEVSARAELAAKAIPFGRELLLLVGVLCLSSTWGPPMDQVGWNMKEWARMLVVGVLVGLGWLLVYVLILVFVRPTKSQWRQHRYLSGSALYWICLYSGAAVAEELWRGYCLTILDASHAVGSFGALLVTSIAFGLAHSRSRSRMGTMLLFAGVLGFLFLWGRSQWATVGASYSQSRDNRSGPVVVRIRQELRTAKWAVRIFVSSLNPLSTPRTNLQIQIRIRWHRDRPSSCRRQKTLLACGAFIVC